MHSQPPSEDIHDLVELADQGRDCVLAVVLETNGSTPCKVGAKAIMDAEGVIHGTIGGGLVEAETQRCAAEAIETGHPVVLDFNLDESTPSAMTSRFAAERCECCWIRPPFGTARPTLPHPRFDVDRQRGVLLTTVRVGRSGRSPSSSWSRRRFPRT